MDIGVNCFTREFSDIFTLILTKIPWPWTCCPRCSVQGMMWSCRPRVELHGVLWCRQGSLVLLMIWAELSDEPQLCYYVNIIWNHNAIQMNKWIFLFWHRHNHLRSIILQSYHISIVFIFWFRWKSSHFDFFHSYCSLSLSLFCSPSFPCCISFSFSFSWNVSLAESFPCINWKLIWLSSN